MGNLWLKIKIWSKIILAIALAIFALLFVYKNEDQPAHIWFWKWIDTSVLKLSVFIVVFSVVATLLVGTVFRTIRQIRELRERTKHEQMKQELTDMHVKASMLNTKPEEKRE